MILIDTGPLVARFIKTDQHHRVALSAWQRLDASRQPCATTNMVLEEAISLLTRRIGSRLAVERARFWYQSSRMAIWRPVQEDELEALNILEKFADQDFSFTDCISFVLMRKNKLKRAFTFDRHFRTAGFTVWP